MLLRKGKSNFFALFSMDYPYLVPNTDPFTFWYRKYEKLNAAKAFVSADRDEKIEQAADSIERDLILLGATAVEDKLQQGVCRTAGEAPTAEIFIKRGKKLHKPVWQDAKQRKQT